LSKHFRTGPEKEKEWSLRRPNNVGLMDVDNTVRKKIEILKMHFIFVEKMRVEYKTGSG
jgi:hypothetical protein